ncbi:MAG: serine--tRNA ligase [Candidatus Muiribacteriota bacterium]
MLDIKDIRKRPEFYEEKLKTRNNELSVKELLQFDEERRELQAKIDKAKAQRNSINKELPKATDKKELISQMKEISSLIKDDEKRESELSHQINSILACFPNIPHDSVKISNNEEDNVVLKKYGEIPEFNFAVKDHMELGSIHDILDFDRAAKITGARFCLYKGLGARMERALLNFMLDLQTEKHGFKEVITPFLVNAASLFTTSNLPKFEQDLFKTQDDYYLLPTSEVSIVNIHRDEIVDKDELPLKYTGYTPCFRQEAGSYGRDVKGLIRNHQFNKVELVVFCHPDESEKMLDKIVDYAEEVLELLKLPFQRVGLVTGDLSNASTKTIDLEVWLPGQQKYREVSSCSNCTDFQARRGNIKFRDENKKTHFLHTLNGSGLATSRLLPAIFENYQQEDGSIKVPEVLVPYVGETVIVADATSN